MNQNPQNIKEFVKLMNKYESLTLEEIKSEWKKIGTPQAYGGCVARNLTGFGNSSTCTLCLCINQVCKLCVYGTTNYPPEYGCISDRHTKTYDDIDNAKTPIQLRNALRRRAKHMRKCYPHLFQQQ